MGLLEKLENNFAQPIVVVIWCYLYGLGKMNHIVPSKNIDMVIQVINYNNIYCSHNMQLHPQILEQMIIT